jgi:hypothetical protein
MNLGANASTLSASSAHPSPYLQGRHCAVQYILDISYSAKATFALDCCNVAPLATNSDLLDSFIIEISAGSFSVKNAKLCALSVLIRFVQSLPSSFVSGVRLCAGTSLVNIPRRRSVLIAPP